jgi:hypothetical protein
LRSYSKERSERTGAHDDLCTLVQAFFAIRTHFSMSAPVRFMPKRAQVRTGAMFQAATNVQKTRQVRSEDTNAAA